MDLAAKGLGAKEWNNSLQTKLSLLPKKLYRIRMSRKFGMKMLTMTNLSTECLIQLTKLGYDATPFNQILKQNAKREMRLRLGFFFQAEDGIRDGTVTGVQTCALPICSATPRGPRARHRTRPRRPGCSRASPGRRCRGSRRTPPAP